MKSISSDEQDVNEATAALKGLLGLGSNFTSSISQNRDSPTTSSMATTSAVNVITPTADDEPDEANGDKFIDNVEVNDASNSKTKKKKTSRKKKTLNAGGTTGSTANASGTANATSPPNGKTTSNGTGKKKTNNKTHETNVHKNETPTAHHDINHTSNGSNNLNKGNPNVPKGSSSTTKKQPNKAANNNHHNNIKKESENFAWSAFQSSPDASKLPIPSFLSPGGTTATTAAAVGTESSNRTILNDTGTSSPFLNNVSASAAAVTSSYDSDTIVSTPVDGSLHRNDSETNYPEVVNDKHTLPNDKSCNDPTPALKSVVPAAENVRDTGVNLAAALAASRPNETTNTNSVSSFVSSPPAINNTLYPSVPPPPQQQQQQQLSMYPNNFVPSPINHGQIQQQHVPPFHHHHHPHQYPMAQQNHPLYQHAPQQQQLPQPTHMTNHHYPLPHVQQQQQQPPNQPVPHNPYAAPPGYITIQVQVPPNLIMPGRTMIVSSPAGYPVQISIPDGVVPGMIIPVHVPIGPPLHMMPPTSQQQQQQQQQRGMMLHHHLSPQSLQQQEQQQYDNHRG